MAEPAAAEKAVLAANAAFYAAFNQRDMSAMERIWAVRLPVICIHPGWDVLLGREAILESWRSILGNPQQPRIVTGGASVAFVGDMAFVVCRELVGGSRLLATNVFALEDGSWRLVHHQSGPVYSPNV